MVRPPPPSAWRQTLRGGGLRPRPSKSPGRPAPAAALRRIGTVLSAPVIWSMILPIALIDVWASAYQALCFRIYGVPRVRRGGFFRYDRSGLPQLNAVERINCAYCTYANGVIAYVREIAARTEQYWCPIRHNPPPEGAHDRHAAFDAYTPASSHETDEAVRDWRSRLARQRDALRAHD